MASTQLGGGKSAEGEFRYAVDGYLEIDESGKPVLVRWRNSNDIYATTIV